MAVQLAGLAEGRYRLKLAAVDRAGNPAKPIKPLVWTLDLTPPTTRVLSRPRELSSRCVLFM